eukprot:TRINITY_DN4194_c0_g1_i1.p1 TRINITY_DN4194_c0_g1~~TRINITY_DN4194_c0_g1_i1.p1  ORF type:complete len:285 (-),score=38.92 TRINITY_DN4194_c0_g1_i1:78-932(-)
MTAPSDHVMMSDLPGGLDEEGLRVMCAGATVKWCKIAPDKYKPGQTSAIVELSSVEDATFLVENLNGTVLPGLERPVNVKFKQPNPAGKGNSFGGGAAAGNTAPYNNWPWGGVHGGNAGSFNARGPNQSYGKGGPYGKAGYAQAGGKDGSFRKPPGTVAGFGGAPAPPTYTAKSMVKDLIDSGGLPGGKWKNDEKTVYVDGLPSDTTDLEVYIIFSAFGALQPGGVSVMLNKDGSSKGYAFVNFQDPSTGALAILTLNGTTLPNGAQLRVMPFTPKPGASSEQH